MLRGPALLHELEEVGESLLVSAARRPGQLPGALVELLRQFGRLGCGTTHFLQEQGKFSGLHFAPAGRACRRWGNFKRWLPVKKVF